MSSRYNSLSQEDDWQSQPSTTLDHTQNDSSCAKAGFDLIFFGRFFSIVKILYSFGSKFVTFAVTFALVMTAIGNVYVISYTGDVTAGFVDSIINKDKSKFWNILILSSIIIIGSALLDSTIKFFVEWLAFCWRRTLSLYIQELYFVDILFYKIISFDRRIDNPDQRITQDVDKFSTSLSLVLSGCVTAPLTIVLYTVRTYFSIGWFAPVIVTAYFLIGYLLNKLIMGSLAKLVAIQEQLEGDFRFDHVRVRTCAESIAIYDGGERERIHTEKTFFELLRNQMKIMRWHWGLNASSNTFAYIGSVLNYVIVAIPVFFLYDDSFDSSASGVLKASFNCIMLISGFSQFTNVSQQMSDIAGFTTRISYMIETLNDLKSQQYRKSHTDSQGSLNTNTDYREELENADNCIRFEDVTCFTPTGLKLVNKLSLVVHPGMNLLITGPSGSGKSSILRILNGIWPFYEGTIVKPSAEGHSMFYLPQKPYLFYGTLKEQVVYPKPNQQYLNSVIVEDELTDNELFDILSLVNMSKLQRRYKFDEQVNWVDILSPGEQQLLSFARLLYHKPKFAVLDEATSSLHEEIEYFLYDLCTKREITLVSVGHRASLRSFHSHLLELDENHNWVLSQLSK